MKNTNLGELEQEVMEYVWKNNPCSVRDVLIHLEKDRKIAYTTVATILHRLCLKNLIVKKHMPSGFIYKPNISKENYTKQIANSFLKKFIGSFGDEAIVSFAESVDKLPKEKRKYFLELLEKYDSDK